MEALGSAFAAGIWYAIGFGLLAVIALVAVIAACVVFIARKPPERPVAPWELDPEAFAPGADERIDGR